MRELAEQRRLDQLPGWAQKYLGLGALPSDSADLRARKALLVLSTTLMASLSFVWVGTYAVLGLWVSAAIPFAYQLASAASIMTFARTRRYRLFRASQLIMSLLLPFVLQWSLGGFENSSAVCLWGITAPLGALLFVGARQAIPWFMAFIGLVMISALLDPVLADNTPAIPEGVIIAFFAFTILGVATTVFALLEYFVRARELEQAKSERLLLNVLPATVAERLKQDDAIIADDFADVSVLFADIVGFTPLAQRLEAPEVVAVLDEIFARWDGLVARLGLEKIKTIGDAYMVAGGVPVARPDHTEAIARLALAMGPQLAGCAERTGVSLQLRIGIATGPVVAGVIGRAKFSYDLWGDVVNTASRMESHAEPGTIQVTERAEERLRESFELRRRGTIDVKGKGPMTSYLLIGPSRTG